MRICQALFSNVRRAAKVAERKWAMFKVTLVRHGETEFNKSGNVQGQLDEPLNDTGKSQALALARCISQETYTHIFASDLVRASETCKLALSLNTSFQCKSNHVKIQLDPLLRERSYGCLEGKPFSEYVKAAKASGVDFMWFTPDGGETRPDLYKRTETFFINMCKDIHSNLTNSREDKIPVANILVVAHGAYLRAMCEMLRDKYGCAFAQDIKPSMSNAARTTLKVTLPCHNEADVVFQRDPGAESDEDWKSGLTVICPSFNVPVQL